MTENKKIIETDFLVNFCKKCNNQVLLREFIQKGESQIFQEAMEKAFPNQVGKFKRVLFLDFCACGDIWISQSKEKVI